MAKAGCPSCGSGTTRRNTRPANDVGALYVVAKVEEDRRERVKAFDIFYAAHLARLALESEAT